MHILTKVVFHCVACEDILLYLSSKAAFSNPPNRPSGFHIISTSFPCGTLVPGPELGGEKISLDRAAVKLFSENPDP